MKITWNKNVEPQNKAEIEKYLTPWLWLVPSWCHDITISAWSDGDGAAIRTSIRYEYRKADMDFFGGWFLATPEDKQLQVVHDLLHINSSIYVDFAENAFDNIADSEQSKGFLKESSRMYCESMTQDMAIALVNKFNNSTGVQPSRM